jgi:diguanylate cyclase (GGDEF)-like protein
MEAAPTLRNDRNRVASLRRLGLLDTGPEERFDRITRTAQRLFGVETALVSLVDVDRQWFKSRQGMAATETARDISFCGHAITGREVLEVDDTLCDPRFSDNPLVTEEPKVRFYAGCPISGPDGAVIGTLCLLDNRPRHLNGEQLDSLHDLAAMVEHEIAVTKLAVDDELTGLANRRGFSLLGDQALAFCERQQVDALVVFADVDGLKAVNDAYGHEYGDTLLTWAAAAMADAFRASDVVGRIGGDEFAAVLTSFVGGEYRACERLDSAVKEVNAGLGDVPFDLSMSVGTARFQHQHPDDLETLLRRADASMYADKQRRRALRRTF